MGAYRPCKPFVMERDWRISVVQRLIEAIALRQKTSPISKLRVTMQTVKMWHHQHDTCPLRLWLSVLVSAPSFFIPQIQLFLS